MPRSVASAMEEASAALGALLELEAATTWSSPPVATGSAMPEETSSAKGKRPKSVSQRLSSLLSESLESLSLEELDDDKDLRHGRALGARRLRIGVSVLLLGGGSFVEISLPLRRGHL
eukprot:Skav229159  [mRNA]  locus=scaffold1381:38796:42836:- [translate_table: standard]